ncbi:hypothetical protein Ciccas_006333 [Cichlidogyrus casuarinus]|uniref:Transposase n=1 Tax=Cichlidogyrus casuarinus TaxID=1844966 RepID=A0ABD2Q6F3_9PLAT
MRLVSVTFFKSEEEARASWKNLAKSSQGKTRREKKSKWANHLRFICSCKYMVQIYQRPLGEWVVSANKGEHSCKNKIPSPAKRPIVIRRIPLHLTSLPLAKNNKIPSTAKRPIVVRRIPLDLTSLPLAKNNIAKTPVVVSSLPAIGNINGPVNSQEEGRNTRDVAVDTRDLLVPISEITFDPLSKFAFKHTFKTLAEFRSWLFTFEKLHNFKYTTRRSSNNHGKIMVRASCSRKDCPSRFEVRCGYVIYSPHNHGPELLTTALLRNKLRAAFSDAINPNQIFMKFLYETKLNSLEQLTSDLIPKSKFVKKIYSSFKQKPSREIKKLKRRSYRTSNRKEHYTFKDKYASFAEENPFPFNNTSQPTELKNEARNKKPTKAFAFDLDI